MNLTLDKRPILTFLLLLPIAIAQAGWFSQHAMSQAIVQIQKLTPSNGAIDDAFGYFVDMDAGTGIVANFPLFGTGTAYLYNTTTFAETILPTPAGVTADDFYGTVVSIDGNSALVGAPGDTTLGPPPAGGVYAFSVATGMETGLGKITPTGSANGDEFSFSMGQDGTNALVGAPMGGNSQGEAHLINSATGATIQSFTASDGFVSDNYGYAVDVEGTNGLVGAPIDANQVGSPGPGAAYIYDLNTLVETKLTAPAASCPGANCDGNEFGWSLAISGSRAVIGAPNRGVGEGRAYIYDLSVPANPPLVLTPPASASGDEFGFAVDIDGNHVVVGAPSDSDSKAYLFDANTGLLIQELVPSDALPTDEYGFGVAVSSGQALVGAPGHDSFSGAAYLFSIPEPAGLAMMLAASLMLGSVRPRRWCS